MAAVNVKYKSPGNDKNACRLSGYPTFCGT